MSNKPSDNARLNDQGNLQGNGQQSTRKAPKQQAFKRQQAPKKAKGANPTGISAP